MAKECLPACADAELVQSDAGGNEECWRGLSPFQCILNGGLPRQVHRRLYFLQRGARPRTVSVGLPS